MSVEDRVKKIVSDQLGKSMDEIQDIIDIIPGQLTGTILSHKDEYFQLLPLISNLSGI